jgi:CheY-like chemotaxis protein
VPREKILVAEDDRTARVSLAELLEGHGFEVVLAETGAQAESILSEKEPDLALLDIRMPDRTA